MTSPNDTAQPLPFDVGTVLAGVRARWRIFVVTAVIGSALGVTAALLFGSKTYEAETVLKYQPEAGCPSSLCAPPAPTLSSLMELVKVPTVLAKVREKLGWTMTLQKLGSAVTVSVKKGTDVLVLRARANTPERAQTLCLTVREVFLADQAARLQDEKIRSLMRQTEAARDELAVVNTQLTGLMERTAALREQAAQERMQLDEVGGNRARIRRQMILEKITDEQRFRVARSELIQAESEYQRAQILARRGLIALSELDKAKTAYQKAKALAVDSPQAQQWKTERQRLEDLAANDGSGLTSSEQLLLLVLNRGVELELRRMELSEKDKALTADIQAISSSRQKLEITDTGFAIISEPDPPTLPLSSTKRLVALAVLLICLLAGVVGVFVLEMKDRTIRSSAEARLHLDLPLLAVVPETQAGVEPRETFKLLASRLRKVLRANGWRRVLITSALQHEGRTTTCVALARGLGALGERVRIETIAPAPPPLASSPPPPKRAPGTTGSHGEGPLGPTVVLVDGPPILPNASMELISHSVDCALMVVKASETRREYVRAALSRLREAGVERLGVVLNGARRRFLNELDTVEGAT